MGYTAPRIHELYPDPKQNPPGLSPGRVGSPEVNSYSRKQQRLKNARNLENYLHKASKMASFSWRKAPLAHLTTLLKLWLVFNFKTVPKSMNLVPKMCKMASPNFQVVTNMLQTPPLPDATGPGHAGCIRRGVARRPQGCPKMIIFPSARSLEGQMARERLEETEVWSTGGTAGAIDDTI
jgi:hypothetical protein